MFAFLQALSKEHADLAALVVVVGMAFAAVVKVVRTTHRGRR